MNVTYEKKDAMTLIGYHTEIRPEEANDLDRIPYGDPSGGSLSEMSGILGQRICGKICTALADDEAGECCGESDP